MFQCLWNYGGADTRNFLRKLLSAYDIVPVCCGQYLYLNESSIMIFATKQQRKARYQHQMVSYKQLLYVSNGLQSYPKRGCSSLWMVKLLSLYISLNLTWITTWARSHCNHKYMINIHCMYKHSRYFPGHSLTIWNMEICTLNPPSEFTEFTDQALEWNRVSWRNVPRLQDQTSSSSSAMWQHKVTLHH